MLQCIGIILLILSLTDGSGHAEKCLLILPWEDAQNSTRYMMVGMMPIWVQVSIISSSGS